MSNELFAAALGVETPWYVKDAKFDAGKRLLTIAIDFKKGSRFPYEGAEGLHPVHDTQIKRYRHLNFLKCYLEVRTPRMMGRGLGGTMCLRSASGAASNMRRSICGPMMA